MRLQSLSPLVHPCRWAPGLSLKPVAAHKAPTGASRPMHVKIPLGLRTFFLPQSTNFTFGVPGLDPIFLLSV